MPDIYWYVFWVGVVLITAGLFVSGGIIAHRQRMEVLGVLRSCAVDAFIRLGAPAVAGYLAYSGALLLLAETLTGGWLLFAGAGCGARRSLIFAMPRRSPYRGM